MRLWLCFICLLVLAGCGTRGGYKGTAPVTAKGEYKVGKPYKVSGKWYTPKEDPGYNRTGLASWYGSKFHGRKTANGEIFNMNALTAAHTTLPLPSRVRVTNLENGRWLILRVNDRGPFVGNRLIDVSRRAAQLLGFEKQGVTRVRVQVVGKDFKPLLVAKPAQKTPSKNISAKNISAKNIQAQKIQVKNKPRPEIVITEEIVNAPSTVESDAQVYIQVGAFGEKGRAETIVAAIEHIGTTALELVTVNGRNLFRVRMGPVKNRTEADVLLGRLLARGHNTARIIEN